MSRICFTFHIDSKISQRSHRSISHIELYENREVKMFQCPNIWKNVKFCELSIVFQLKYLHLLVLTTYMSKELSDFLSNSYHVYYLVGECERTGHEIPGNLSIPEGISWQMLGLVPSIIHVTCRYPSVI